MSPEGRARRPYAEFMEIWEEGYVRDPASYASMHAPFLFVLDGGPLRTADGTLDRARILDYIAAVVDREPARFRLRLQRSAGGLTPPAWVPDDRFDLARHVRFADGVESLSDATLRRLAGDDDGLLSLRHPLWRFRVTELTGGAVALGIVIHHASNDGTSSIRLMSAITHRRPDDAAGDAGAGAPFDGRPPARSWQLPLLALRDRLDRHAPRSGRRPLRRRARRVLARWLVPWRFLHRVDVPRRFSASAEMDAHEVGERARELGGSVGILQAAAVIAAWDGGERAIGLRFPMSLHTGGGTPHRNNVRDVLLTGDADADPAATVPSLRAQVEQHERATPVPGLLPGGSIGYSTVLPWVSRPRFFCGAEVRAVIPFPASLPEDGLSAAGIVYAGRIHVGVNTAADRDPTEALARIRTIMTGAARPGAR